MKPLRAMCMGLPVAVLVSCATQPRLVPSPMATLSGPNTAFTEAAGVRVWAHGQWWGDPPGLGDLLTPVRVTLENRGQRPVRVSYRDCALVGPSGFRYAALPPFPVPQPVSEVSPAPGIRLADYHPAAPVKTTAKKVRPRHPHTRFYFAPPYINVYPGMLFWPSVWAWHLSYSQLYGAWPRALPTQDMQEQALPEGVLQPGGAVSGYLYFQHASREASVQLQLQLVDAETEQPLGTATLPFVLRY